MTYRQLRGISIQTRTINTRRSEPASIRLHEFRRKFIIWTLLDTGLRVAELAGFKKENIDWQSHRVMIYGKGGPYGTKSKRRVIPLAAREQPLLEGHFALHDELAA